MMTHFKSRKMAKETKKPAKKASNVFHNIMKASVNIPLPKKPYPDCMECGKEGEELISHKQNGKQVIYTYKCPNGHLFTEEHILS
jgi:hypothetical protein